MLAGNLYLDAGFGRLFDLARGAILALPAAWTLAVVARGVIPLTVVALTLVSGGVIALSIIALAVIALAVVARRIVTLALIPGRIVPVTILTPLVAGARVALAIVALLTVLARTILPDPLVARTIVAVPLLPGGLALLAGADRFALVAVIVIAIHLEIGLLTSRLRLLVLEATALIAQHTEIVIRELVIIFGVDPVTLTLGIGGQILVLLVQLVRVAAGAVVDAIAVVGTSLATLTRAARIAATTSTIAAATTTTASLLLPIVDQACCPCPNAETGSRARPQWLTSPHDTLADVTSGLPQPRNATS